MDCVAEQKKVSHKPIDEKISEAQGLVYDLHASLPPTNHNGCLKIYRCLRDLLASILKEVEAPVPVVVDCRRTAVRQLLELGFKITNSAELSDVDMEIIGLRAEAAAAQIREYLQMKERANQQEVMEVTNG